MNFFCFFFVENSFGVGGDVRCKPSKVAGAGEECRRMTAVAMVSGAGHYLCVVRS